MWQPRTALERLEARVSSEYSAWLEDEGSELSEEQVIEEISTKIIDEEVNAEVASEVVREVLERKMWEINAERSEGAFFESLP